MWKHKKAIGLGVLIVAALAWSVVIYYSNPTLAVMTIDYAVCIVLGGIAWFCAAFRLD